MKRQSQKKAPIIKGDVEMGAILRDFHATGVTRGFHVNQLRKLQGPLDQHQVHVRETEGRQLRYIEGWYAISKANEIFGYAGWDRETIFLERTFECIKPDVATCGYTARVRIRVRAGSTEISREGTGWGFATARTPGGAHERALKSAETDATKRALSTFGGQFGLNLYDKEHAANTRRKAPKCVLFAPDGQPFADNLSPEAFSTGLRQLIEKCQSPAETNALIHWNNGSLSGLRGSAPDLRNTQGVHFTDLLLRLAERSIRRMETAFTQKGPGANGFAELLPPPNPYLPKEKVVPIEGTSEVSLSIQAEATFGPTTLAVGFSGAELAALDAKQSVSGTVQNAIGEQLQPKMAEQTLDAQSASRIGTGQRIDKSVLPIGFERRIRSKLHLKKVGELPCLICNRQPSHAHHVKFAQRRGLSQKVSDEYVVPLCALHHGDLHRATSERDWWQRQGHDPLAIAAGLWDRFGRNLN